MNVLTSAAHRPFADLFDRDDALVICLHELDRAHIYAELVFASMKARRDVG